VTYVVNEFPYFIFPAVLLEELCFMLGLYAFINLVFQPGGNAVWRQQIVSLFATCDTKPTSSGISLTNLISGHVYDLIPLYSFYITR